MGCQAERVVEHSGSFGTVVRAGHSCALTIHSYGTGTVTENKGHAFFFVGVMPAFGTDDARWCVRMNAGGGTPISLAVPYVGG